MAFISELDRRHLRRLRLNARQVAIHATPSEQQDLERIIRLVQGGYVPLEDANTEIAKMRTVQQNRVTPRAASLPT